MKYCFYFMTLLLTLIASAFAQNQTKPSPVLGKIVFPTSGSPAAQNYFIQGVLFLHSFDYEPARKRFKKAESLDPSFALAYWGEAMTYNQPVWNHQDLESGKAALNKLAPTDEGRIQKALTPKEKGFIQAANTLFGSGNKIQRDLAYAGVMRKLYEQYPNDDEIASFYALSLIGTTEEKRDYKTYMQVAAIAEDILQHNAQHPGALHYAIHVYDDPIHAPLGLRAARVYAKIAPDASHALHMPSHIFYALGLWDDVIASNKTAWEAGLKNNPQHLAKNFTVHDVHALHWLQFGYLQKKNYQEAYRLTKLTQKLVEEYPSPMLIQHYALMYAAYINESGHWNTDLIPPNTQGLEPGAQAINIYTQAMIAMHKNTANAKALISEALTKLAKLSQMRADDSQSIKQGASYAMPTPRGIVRAKIALLELQAQLLIQEKKLKEAITILRQAAQLEDHLPFGFGPPHPVKPPHELLADSLLLDQQYKNAYEEYAKALKLQPNRPLSRQGLLQAAKLMKAHGVSVPEANDLYFNRLMN